MMKISISDFVSGLKDSVITKHGDSSLLSSRAVRAIALAVTVSLTGCASPAFDTAQQAVDTSYGQTQVKEITSTNYKEIVNERQSGIYQHPLYDGKLATFHFSDDMGAEQAIKDDLKELGLSESNFDYNHAIYSAIAGSNSGASRHVQDPIGFYEDINYSYINHGMADYEDIEPTAQDISINEDMVYFTLMHEAGHSVIEQQMDLIDFVKVPFSATQLLYLENSSDSIGLIKTIQMMHEAGRSAEHIDTVMDRVIKERESIVKMKNDEVRLPDSDYAILHRTVPSMRIVAKMYDENPSFIVNLSNNETLKISDIVATSVMDHDFKEDFINEMGSKDRVANADTKSKLELGVMTKTLLGFLSNPVSGLSYEKEAETNAKLIQQVSNSIGETYITKIADEIAKDPLKYRELSKENLDGTVREILDTVISEITVHDMNQNRYASYATELTGLYDKVKEKMEDNDININQVNNDYTVTHSSYNGYSM
nr:hypothetical protein [Vibrio splendidus]MCC4880299.1 hypothetical protein [Vibrio splendidus]